MITRQHQAVIDVLRHGALGPQAVATQTGISPARVREILHHLKRQRLVREHLSARVHEWQLTSRGLSEAWAPRQDRLL
jgi:DNA-binding IclR family transcriptional regulator